MTKQEFQRKYHDYAEQDGERARQEAERVNREAEGFRVEAVNFGALGWGLMLSEAASFVRSLDLLGG